MSNDPKGFIPLDDFENNNVESPEGFVSLDEYEKTDSGKAFTKGTLKGLSKTPKNIYSIAQQIQGKFDLSKDLPTKFILDPLEKFLSGKIDELATTPEEMQKFEKAGERFGGGVSWGISPIAALGGAALGQLTEEVGGGETAQALAELLGAGLPGVLEKGASKVINALTPKQLAKTESGLLKYGQPKTFLGLKPKAFQSRINAQVNKQIDLATNKIDKIVSSKLIPSDKKAGLMINEVRNIAEKNKIPINPEKIINSIDSQIETYYEKGFAPSNKEKSIINVLEEMKSDLENTFRRKGHILPADIENQYRKVNENSKEAYKRAFPTEKDYATREARDVITNIVGSELKESMGNDPKFNKLFDESNKLYKMESNIRDFEEIANNWFTDDILNPSSFKKSLNSKKGYEEVVRILGKDNANQLKILSNELGDFSKNINKVTPFLAKKDWGAVLGFLPKFIPFLGPYGKIYLIKPTIEATLGYIYTSPQRAKIMTNFVKATAQNKIPQALYFAEKLNKILEDAEKAPELEED